MVVSCCMHESHKKFGKNATGKQRLRCKLCGHTWLEDAPKPIGDLRISLRDAQTVLGLLLEGMSLRAASRLTGLDRNTIGDLKAMLASRRRAFIAIHRQTSPRQRSTASGVLLTGDCVGSLRREAKLAQYARDVSRVLVPRRSQIGSTNRAGPPIGRDARLTRLGDDQMDQFVPLRDEELALAPWVQIGGDAVFAAVTPGTPPAFRAAAISTETFGHRADGPPRWRHAGAPRPRVSSSATPPSDLIHLTAALSDPGRARSPREGQYRRVWQRAECSRVVAG